MTKLLEKAISAAEKLSQPEQDAIAAIILEELTDEQRWVTTFEKSSGQLAKIASEALAEYKAGRTKPLNL